MQKILKNFIVIGVLFGLVSLNCATLTRGSDQPMQFNSNPMGATILLNGQEMGTTPANFVLKRGTPYSILLKRDGYEDVMMNITKEFKMKAAVVGNAFSWSLFGLVVDVVTGSAYELTPAQLNATLRSKEIIIDRNSNPDEVQVFIFMLEDVKDIIKDFSKKFPVN